MGSLRSVALPRRRKPAKGGMEALAGQIRRPKVGRRPKEGRNPKVEGRNKSEPPSGFGFRTSKLSGKCRLVAIVCTDAATERGHSCPLPERSQPRSGQIGPIGRSLAPPPERRIHLAARRAALGLPDESDVPIGIAARLGGCARMRPVLWGEF